MAFEYFPEPDNPALLRGPSDWAKDLWIEEMPYAVRKQKAHFHHLDIGICVAGAGTGKCLRAGVPVILSDGSVKKVEDILVGDLILGPHSEAKRVVSLARGREVMYEVRSKQGTFTCNESHILSLVSSGLRVGWENRKEILETGKLWNVSVKDFLTLSKRNQKCWKLYRSGPVEFSRPKVQFDLSPIFVDPYFLGLWLGDGTCSNQNITNPEPEVIQWMQDYAVRIGQCCRTFQSSGCYTISINSGPGAKPNLLLDKLRGLGLIGNKHIPQVYLTASIEDRLQLLAGLLDTDGYFAARDGYYEISQKDERLADDIVFLARSLGFLANKKTTKKSCTHKGQKIEGTYHVVNISGAIHTIPLRVERKKCPVLKPNKNHLVRGFELIRLDEGDYYGFELEGEDRRFLLGDFTVAHNSFNSGSRGMYLARKWKNGELMLGAMNYPQLERNQINYWQSRFAENGDGNIKTWGGKKVVARPPTDKRRWVELPNGTKIYLMNLEMWETVVGLTLGFILIEEANNIKKGAQGYFQLMARLRKGNMPLHQVLLLANPRLQGSWMYDTFNMKQFQPNYKGEPLPIGKPCRCQYCSACFQVEGIEVEFKNEECPRCGIINNRPRNIQYCRNCRATKKKLVKYNGIQCQTCGWYKCPGEQNFHRFITSSLSQNQFADEGLLENMRSTMSAVQFKLLGEGKILDTNTGIIHVGWSDTENVLPKNTPMDMDRDIQWCQDFNNDPMSTVLAQKYDNGDKHLAVVKDEIVTFRATAHDSVAEFANRYPHFKKKIVVWGDPAGYQGGIKEKVLDRYEQLCQAFDEYGYDYELRALPNKMSIFSRLDTLNWHLSDAKGEVRLQINPKCVWTIESIRGVEWDKNGNKEDEKHDKWFRSQALEGNVPPGVPNDGISPKPLTHLQAALGYWLNLEFPQVQYVEPYTWHREPDGTLVEFRQNAIIERKPDWSQSLDLESFNPDKHSLDSMVEEGMSYSESLGSIVREGFSFM